MKSRQPCRRSKITIGSQRSFLSTCLRMRVLFTRGRRGHVHDDGHMSLWFFGRNNIPQGLLGDSPMPPLDVKPMGRYHTSEQDCPAGHFNQQQMIFDITLCGQWAGREFLNAGCGQALPGQSSYAACDAYVGANPAAFSESRWEINSLRAYGSWTVKVPPSSSGFNWMHWLQVLLVRNMHRTSAAVTSSLKFISFSNCQPCHRR
jgi:hypothetical protein